MLSASSNGIVNTKVHALRASTDEVLQLSLLYQDCKYSVSSLGVSFAGR